MLTAQGEVFDLVEGAGAELVGGGCVGVGVGVALGCLTTAGIISFFVLRHLKRQREKAKEEDWLRRLNSSVYTFLHNDTWSYTPSM